MSGRILIVKTGSTLPGILAERGDFEGWIAAGMGLGAGEVDVVAPPHGEALPAPRDAAGVVVTGSAAFVSDREPWSEATAGWLREVVDADVPVLGICYGHQLLAHAYGGEVGRNPRGREIGTIEIDAALAIAADDPLLGALPARATVHVTHVESVLSLPDGARLLATSPDDPHHAFALGERAWGVQFHPEFDAGVARGYVEAKADDLRSEGLDPERLAAGVRETDVGPGLLARFRRLVESLRA